MPFKSAAQNRWGHTEAGMKALGGPAAVKEWEGATDYKHLPERKGYAQGGPVKKIGQDVGDSIPKATPFEHTKTAGGGANPDKAIGGHNDGHGIFTHPRTELYSKGGTPYMYAQGGPVRNSEPDKHYKQPDNRDGKSGRYTTKDDFLLKSDRFTGGRMPVDYPDEADTEEDWTKPAGVGTKEPDDYGDCKTLKPVLPHETGGRYSYAKGETQTTTDTFNEGHYPKAD